MFEVARGLIYGRNKLDREPCTACGPILYRDGGAVQFDDALNDRESKSCTALLTAIAAPEPAEDKLSLFVQYARTLIQHTYLAVFLDHKLHHRLWRSVFDR